MEKLFYELKPYACILASLYCLFYTDSSIGRFSAYLLALATVIIFWKRWRNLHPRIEPKPKNGRKVTTKDAKKSGQKTTVKYYYWEFSSRRFLYFWKNTCIFPDFFLKKRFVFCIHQRDCMILRNHTIRPSNPTVIDEKYFLTSRGVFRMLPKKELIHKSFRLIHHFRFRKQFFYRIGSILGYSFKCKCLRDIESSDSCSPERGDTRGKINEFSEISRDTPNIGAFTHFRV